MQTKSFVQTTDWMAMAVAAAAVACGISTGRAAVLSSVPMQGGMVMPMIMYHAEHGHLHVMLPSEVPQLTPLLVSHPGDRFDPADPWFDALDPSRQGLSFSRRYGFMMDANTDPLPPNTAIWLRKIAGSPELGFYRYSGSAPKLWQPIFGTGGTTNASYWDGTMFHPAVTAPPGTNALSATFEAYLVDTQTGAEIPGSSTGPFVLPFTNISDGRPALEIGARILVFYPAEATNWVLEATDTLPSGTWSDVTNTPVIVNGRAAVVIEPGDPRRFFRMRLAP